ncbi:MAG TPA: ABC transporter substrate-binding protein [Dehalococcoidia bacterium]|nr:ABC transporter substrate-binding protein [Dehalococcoidia bacterium]
MEYRWFTGVKVLPLTLLVLALLLVVACGSAAAPETDTSAPATSAPPAAAAGTAVPAATALPQVQAEKMVNPGKVTMLTADFGAERFDSVFGSTDKNIRKHFHGNLISWDRSNGQMAFLPGIASKWELSSDAKTTTYTIREGLKFHDGTDITVEDVLWTLQHTMGPQAAEYSKSSPGIRFSGLMDRIELGPGTNQVSLFTTEATPDLWVHSSENEGGASVTEIMPQRAHLNDEQELEAYENQPVGAGPLKVVKHVPLELVAFERHDDFYYQPANGFPTDKRVQFRQLDLRMVPEEATRAAALQTGEADIARVSLSNRQQVEGGGGRMVFSPESAIIESHLWGCRDPQYPCHDQRVRQALNYALDLELMRDRLFGGPEVMEIKGWGVITPSTVGYSPDLDPVPFNPDRARQLFAEAGYKTPANPSGKDFGKLIMNTYQDQVIPSLVEAAQLTADVWKKELGIDAEVRVMDKTTYGQIRTLNVEDFDGTVSWVANNTRMQGAGTLRLYYASPEMGGLRLLHRDPELFALAEQTLDQMNQLGFLESADVFNSTYRRIREEAYQISVGYVNAPWGVGTRIMTWEPYPVAEYASALHTITLK